MQPPCEATDKSEHFFSKPQLICMAIFNIAEGRIRLVQKLNSTEVELKKSKTPLLHGPLPELEGPQHVSLLVHEGGPEQLKGVYPLLLAHKLSLADQVLNNV